MRRATGESDPVIDIGKLEERLDNLRISADSDITVRGSAWQGYAVNIPACPEIIVQGVTTCCNRDVTEIITMRMTGDFTLEIVGYETISCSYDLAWTRIPNADSFDPDLRQFKLYFGELPTCQLFAIFNQPGFGSPTGTCQTTGTYDTIFGSSQIEEFMVFGSNIRLKFRSDTSENALGNGCSIDSGEIPVPFTSCNVSALRGIYTITNHCDDIASGFEMIFDMTASVIFKGPCFSIANAGTGYAIGDVLTISSGGESATLVVASVGGGGSIATWTVTFSSFTADHSSLSATGGTGTGAQFNVAITSDPC